MQDYHAKYEEMRKSFEPTASLPFTPSEEMKLYCQTLMEVNERLKLAAPFKQPEQRMGQPDEQRIERYLEMANDMRSYREYGSEMENTSAQMNTHGKNTKIRWQLQNQFDMYRVAQETYLEKMLAKYQLASLEAIQHEMKATEPFIAATYHHTYPSHWRMGERGYMTMLERAYTALQEEQRHRHEGEPNHREPAPDFEDRYRQAAQEHKPHHQSTHVPKNAEHER
jgi:hypothetical protein